LKFEVYEVSFLINELVSFHSRKALSTPNSATRHAGNGDNLSPNSATVAENGYCRRIPQQWPKSATIVASVEGLILTIRYSILALRSLYEYNLPAWC